MPKYIITGTKLTKDGTEQIIREYAPSQVKAQWVAAMYKAEGYSVTVMERRNPPEQEA
jgi:hypothetical protein